MRTLRKNKSTVHVSYYLGLETSFDPDGFETGEKISLFSEPVSLSIHVSPGRGRTETNPFGTLENYDKTMVTTTDAGLAVDDRIWIEANPNTDEHDHVVVGVSKGLAHIVYAIRQVKVS